MFLTKAADAVARRFLPAVTAGASEQASNCYCSVRSSKCSGGYIYEVLYWRVTDYYGNCTIWGAYCSQRRTPDRC
jgi:hypothetical protein